MPEVTFISALPFLTLSSRELSKAVQFVNHYYTTKDPKEIQLLRRFSKSAIFTVAEAGEMELENLIKKYNEAENQRIREAEEREEARQKEELEKIELHNFYNALRFVVEEAPEGWDYDGK